MKKLIIVLALLFLVACSSGDPKTYHIKTPDGSVFEVSYPLCISNNTMVVYCYNDYQTAKTVPPAAQYQAVEFWEIK